VLIVTPHGPRDTDTRRGQGRGPRLHNIRSSKKNTIPSAFHASLRDTGKRQGQRRGPRPAGGWARGRCRLMGGGTSARATRACARARSRAGDTSARRDAESEASLRLATRARVVTAAATRARAATRSPRLLLAQSIQCARARAERRQGEGGRETEAGRGREECRESHPPPSPPPGKGGKKRESGRFHMSERERVGQTDRQKGFE
jgi:hypothetical protein